MDNTKCKNCGTEYTKMDSGCTRCLKCNPVTKIATIAPKETNYVDVKMTETEVREIVRDELENWHITKIADGTIKEARVGIQPEITKDEIPATSIEDMARMHNNTVRDIKKFQSSGPEAIGSRYIEGNWRAQAKALDIPLNQPSGGARKKVDVLADIESKTVSV